MAEFRSPSSRRAWIEIQPSPSLNQRGDVALLAEGVDRNCHADTRGTKATVALLAEGVDRNYHLSAAPAVYPGRPPRGGRG